jgi:hypothetical protein
VSAPPHAAEGNVRIDPRRQLSLHDLVISQLGD